MEVLAGASHECQCSILELIFRNNEFIHPKFTNKIEQSFYNLFPNLEFKKFLTKVFPKMYKFIITMKEQKKKIPEKKNENGDVIEEAKEIVQKSLFKSELRPIYTQFFAKDLQRIWIFDENFDK